MDIPEVIKSMFSDKDHDVMAQHYAAEGHIRVWKVEKLKDAARNLDETEIELSKLSPELRMWLGDNASSAKLSELVSHVERIAAADITIPILIFGEDRIVDGAHRYVRSLLEGRTTIPCKIIIDPPEPDLIIPLSPDGERIYAN